MKSEEIVAVGECAKYITTSVSIIHRTTRKDKIKDIIIEKKTKKERGL